MPEPVATLENVIDRTASRPDMSPQPYQPRGGAMKFALASGSRPLEGFTIKRGIGAGGFGEVYFATSDAGKEVALKRIQRNLDIELRGVSQCLNLKHPNLIALHDIRYDEQGSGWVVMEYVAGESLKDAIDRCPDGMPMDEVRDWFLGISRGVAYLHDHGIVHRDLKPGNIFLDEDAVKIGDYGLSKFISCSRRSGQTESVGTFHYMAPEIGKGVYGKEIDIYALGIILHEMLTGRVPFDGESSQEIIMKHLTADPDLSGIPVASRSVIAKALAKDPDLRYANVGQMVAALQWEPLATAAPPVRPLASERFAAEKSVTSKPVVESEPYYISDDMSDEECAAAEGITLGPLKEVVTAEIAPEPLQRGAGDEPIARAMGSAWHRFSNWWNHTGLGTPLKIVLLVGAVALVILNAEWLLPIGVFCGILYLVYFAIRSLVLAGGSASATSEPAGAAVAPALVSRRPSARQRRHRKGEALRVALQRKPVGQQLGEWTGSLLMSAIVCSVFGLIMMIVSGRFAVESVYTWSLYGWLTVTSTLGAWTILTLSKFWEGSKGDQVRRRFVMLVAGLGFGMAAFLTSQLLLVGQSSQLNSMTVQGPLRDSQLVSSVLAVDGTLALGAFLVYFAGLFAILRWWKQADPVRSSRLSLWSTGICALWAVLLPFAQPWGVMLAATLSIAVQLSAPWLNSQQRSRVRQQVQDAQFQDA